MDEIMKNSIKGTSLPITDKPRNKLISRVRALIERPAVIKRGCYADHMIVTTGSPTYTNNLILFFLELLGTSHSPAYLAISL